VVFSGKLQKFGRYTWGRYNWIADLSPFREEGKYVLEVKINSVGTAKSPEIEIKNHLYADLAQKGLEYYYIQRCGKEIPGWHRACHLDDAVGKDEKGKKIHVDLTGGWHDAADYSKQDGGDPYSIYALTVLQENLNPDWHRLKDQLPDPLAEAWWGVKYLLKKHLGKGRYIAGTIGAGKPTNKYGMPLSLVFLPPEKTTDNVPGTEDDRTFGKVDGAPVYLHAIAKYAQVVKSYDKEKYEACLKVVRDLCEKHHEKYQNGALHHDFCEYLLLQIFLYELAEENRDLYGKRAREGIRKYLARIDGAERAFLLADKEKDSHQYHKKNPGATWYWWHYSCAVYDFVEVFKKYAGAFPDDPIVPQLKREVRWFMETAIEPLTSKSPYGQMMSFDLENPVDIFANLKPNGTKTGPWDWVCGYNQYLAKISRVCSLAAQVLNEPKYLEIAEKQLQWIMGRNPRGESCMGGVGYREIYCATRLKANPAIDYKTSIPGGVTIGIGAGCPRRFRKLNVAPEGFPCYGGEVWQHSTALTILACQELEYARKILLDKKIIAK